MTRLRSRSDLGFRHWLADSFGRFTNIFCGLDCIVFFFNQQGKCIHNYLAGTRVIYWP